MQVYPTRVRSFALGMNNSLSRVGAIMAPLVAVNLGAGGHLRTAEVIVAAFSIVAAACVLGLPFETSSRSLEVRSPLRCMLLGFRCKALKSDIIPETGRHDHPRMLG